MFFMRFDMQTLFQNVRLIGADEPAETGWLLVQGHRIQGIGTGEPTFPELPGGLEVIDCTGLTLLPGFIDLHTHGALGFDFVFAREHEIQEISRFYAAHGVTSFLATTYAADQDEITPALARIGACVGTEPGARILGVHLEGPWLNPRNAGAQALDRIRTASRTEALPYLDTGLVKLVTLAPEIPENQWLIAECVTRRITVAAGHSSATYEEALLALGSGVNQVTHCFNAMRPLHHREPGLVGAALSQPNYKCELIADNIHVHPAVMKLMLRDKSPEGIILVTDSIAAAGMPDGVYSLEGQPVTCRDGSARLADGTLAGSVLTMDIATANFIQATEEPLEVLWPCTSRNAARAIHLDQCKGSLAPGMDADIVLLDSNLQVKLTMVEGKIVFDDR